MEKNFTSILCLLQSTQAGQTPREDENRTIVLQEDEKSVLMNHESHQFDQVHVSPSPETVNKAIYADSVSKLVKSVLEGYNGSVISLGGTATLFGSNSMLASAAKRIHHYLRKLKKMGFSTNLIVPCSYILVTDGHVYDLLHGHSDNEPSVHMLEVNGGNVCGATSVTIKASSDVSKLLHYGKEMKEQIASKADIIGSSSIFNIGVEYAKFGSMLAPISGTLSFVAVDAPDTPDTSKSFSALSSLIQQLVIKSNDDNDDQPLHLDYSKSNLTLLLRDALGGNSKTLLITHLSDRSKEGTAGIVAMASKARLIENKPNKTELAKKALLNAYMKELKKIYGNEPQEEEEEEGEDRKESEHDKVAEEVAQALAKAIGEDDSDGSDNDEPLFQSTVGHSDEGLMPMRVKVRQKKSSTRSSSLHTSLSSAQAFLSKENTEEESAEDVTINALMSIIQDPDKGAHRARSDSIAQHVKIHRGGGSIFSGASIVKWLVENIDGVGIEKEAEQLGQILLDKGAIFHSEGSRVFANSENLFYYASEGRSAKKSLTQEEVQALLVQSKLDSTGDARKKLSTVQTFTVNKLEDQHIESDALPPNKWHRAQLEPIDHSKLSPEKAQTPNGDEAEGPVKERRHRHKRKSAVSMDDQVKEETDTGDSNATMIMAEKITDEREEEKISSDAPNISDISDVPDLSTIEETDDYPHPLHYAAAIGKTSGCLKQLILWYGVDQTDDFGRTPLMFAALGNKQAACRTLLECGAVVERTDQNGLTAVHIACYLGHKEPLSILLSKGNNYDCSIQDRMGHTAFHWSMVPSNSQCLKLLLKYSMRKNSTVYHNLDRGGLSPLHWAIYYDHPDHLKLLAARYTNINTLDNDGRSFLTYAIEKNSLHCFEALLELFPGLASISDKNGLLPLHHSCAQDSPEYIQKLLVTTADVDVNSKDSLGRCPMHYATLYNNPLAVKLLLLRDATPLPLDGNGQTPLDLAQSYNMLVADAIVHMLSNGLSEEDRQEIYNSTDTKVCIII